MTRFPTALVVVFLAACACADASRAADAAADPDLPLCPARPDLRVAVDGDAEPGERSAAFARVVDRAMTVDTATRERHVVGSHFRLGMGHPAAVVERDPSRARRLLSHAALGGELYAMLSMAEMELAAGEPMKAMVWVQSFVHFTRQKGDSASEEYVADLMVRIYEKLGRGDDVQQEIDEYVNGFVQTATAKLDAARDAKPAPVCTYASERLETRVLPVDGKRYAARSRASRGLHEPAFALYYLDIDASGTVIDADVIDSLPDGRAAEGLRGTAMRIRFNAVEPGSPVRTVVVPVSYGVGSARFRD